MNTKIIEKMKNLSKGGLVNRLEAINRGNPIMVLIQFF